MSKKINGTFTLKEILTSTYESRAYKNRYDYKERDLLKTIVVIKETTLHPDQTSAPTVSFTFRSFSYPQYKPYTSYTKYSRQKKFKHQYDQILTIEADENNKISLNTFSWKYRLGSQRKWDSHPSQNKIKSIYRETSDRWKIEKERELSVIKRRYTGEILKNKKKELDKKYADKRDKIKKSAPYLDVGDYNSQVNGVNGDFHFRCQSTYSFYNHLYGRNTYPDGDVGEIFAPKHLIGLIDALMKLSLISI